MAPLQPPAGGGWAPAPPLAVPEVQHVPPVGSVAVYVVAHRPDRGQLRLLVARLGGSVARQPHSLCVPSGQVDLEACEREGDFDFEDGAQEAAVVELAGQTGIRLDEETLGSMQELPIGDCSHWGSPPERHRNYCVGLSNFPAVSPPEAHCGHLLAAAGLDFGDDCGNGFHSWVEIGELIRHPDLHPGCRAPLRHLVTSWELGMLKTSRLDPPGELTAAEDAELTAPDAQGPVEEEPAEQQDMDAVYVWEVAYLGGVRVRDEMSTTSNTLAFYKHGQQVLGRENGNWVDLVDEPGFMMIKGEYQGIMMVKVAQAEMEETAEEAAEEAAAPAVEEVCPNGHPLQTAPAFTEGTCDHCHRVVVMGESILECGLCDPPYWWCGCSRVAEQPHLAPHPPPHPPERKVPHTAAASAFRDLPERKVPEKAPTLKFEQPDLAPGFPPRAPAAPPKARRSFYAPVPKEERTMPKPPGPSKGAGKTIKGTGKPMKGSGKFQTLTSRKSPSQPSARVLQQPPKEEPLPPVEPSTEEKAVKYAQAANSYRNRAISGVGPNRSMREVLAEQAAAAKAAAMAAAAKAPSKKRKGPQAWTTEETEAWLGEQLPSGPIIGKTKKGRIATTAGDIILSIKKPRIKPLHEQEAQEEEEEQEEEETPQPSQPAQVGKRMLAARYFQPVGPARRD